MANQIQKLQTTIQEMDALTQGACSEIATIAKLTLARLEHPDAYLFMEDIANALTNIWRNADETQNAVNAMAEDVGANHVNEAKLRRLSARSTAFSQAAR